MGQDNNLAKPKCLNLNSLLGLGGAGPRGLKQRDLMRYETDGVLILQRSWDSVKLLHFILRFERLVNQQRIPIINLPLASHAFQPLTCFSPVEDLSSAEDPDLDDSLSAF